MRSRGLAPGPAWGAFPTAARRAGRISRRPASSRRTFRPGRRPRRICWQRRSGYCLPGTIPKRRAGTRRSGQASRCRPDPVPLLSLLAEAGARADGVRLLNGRFVLKAELHDAQLQILILMPTGRVFGAGKRNRAASRSASRVCSDRGQCRRRVRRPLRREGRGVVVSIGKAKRCAHSRAIRE